MEKLFACSFDNYILHKGFPLLLITNNKKLIHLAPNHVFIDEPNIVKSYFIASLFMELMTCEIALQKGYNPDTNDDLNGIDTF